MSPYRWDYLKNCGMNPICSKSFVPCWKRAGKKSGIKKMMKPLFLSRPKKILTLLLHVSVLMKLKLPYFAWQSIYVAKKHCVRYLIDIICVILIVAIILLLIFLIFHQIMFFAL